MNRSVALLPPSAIHELNSAKRGTALDLNARRIWVARVALQFREDDFHDFKDHTG
jgi:hypothetical protein